MNRLLVRLFMIFLAVCGITNCEPVGSISDGSGKSSSSGNGSSNGGDVELLMLRPNRILYDVDDGVNGRFDLNADLRVFVSDGGEFKPLNTNDPSLKIEVIRNPGLSAEVITPVDNTHFVFAEAGRYIIRGTYNGISDEYSVEVRGSFVNPGDGGNFVDMVWL